MEAKYIFYNQFHSQTISKTYPYPKGEHMGAVGAQICEWYINYEPLMTKSEPKVWLSVYEKGKKVLGKKFWMTRDFVTFFQSHHL
jgi:hypothetical protein